MDITKLKFDEKGLIPAIVIDDKTGKLLTLAYMNAESLEISVNEGRTCFWSRSRQELWRKGESSGNIQYITSIVTDCDRDALAVYVNKTGPACHTGSESCFENVIFGEKRNAFSLDALMDMLKGRKRDMPEGSYTSYLFDKGTDKILKKIGEESTEVIIAAKGGEREETIYEIADLVYHVMVLMVNNGIELSEIKDELASRNVIDHKVKQEKMK